MTATKQEFYALVNIGCIECGVSSNLVGLFTNYDKAAEIRDELNHKADWREGGQNLYEIFIVTDLDVVNEEYLKYLESYAKDNT